MLLLYGVQNELPILLLQSHKSCISKNEEGILNNWHLSF